MTNEPLVMWIVYDHPRDFPNSYVARKFLVTAAGAMPTDELVSSLDVDAIRLLMTAEGLTPLARCQDDDPVIMETWL